MIQIEELMQYASRRKVEAIAATMGYPKAIEYPDEVLAEVQMRCRKRQPRAAVEDKVEAEMEVTECPSGSAIPRQSPTAVAGEAAEQETMNAATEDLKHVDESSQYRAAAMQVSSDALTLFYYATSQFTVPGLKEQVEASRHNLRQALRGMVTAYDPERFLAHTPLAKLAAEKNTAMRLNSESNKGEE